MKNKILIGIAVLLATVVFIVRFNFKSGLESFKLSVSDFEKKQMESFTAEKIKRIDFLRNNDTAIYKLYSSQFNDTLSYDLKDTSFSYFYLSDIIKYRVQKFQYIECLYKKCIVDNKNEISKKLIEPKALALEKKYVESFSKWFNQLADKKLLKRTKINIECGVGFDSIYEIRYDEEAWKEFDRFLASYEKEKQKVDIESKRAEDELDRLASNTRSKLKSGVINYFNNKLNGSRSSLITTAVVPMCFKSPSLGDINYNLSKTTVNKGKFNQIADDAFEEQWQYNSLNQGSMPWAYCYGSRNGCGGYDCSQISVLSGSDDVLVTIKNEEGEVFRHAYIKSGTKFKFSIPNGRYQVFFYSGTGWNPNKFMKNTSCGALKGGFVSNESFTKDSYIDIYNQILSYELIQQVNGNLSIQPSSINEAL